MEWFSKKTSIAGVQNSQLGGRSHFRRSNLTRLLIHALSRSSSNPATGLGNRPAPTRRMRPPKQKEVPTKVGTSR